MRQRQTRIKIHKRENPRRGGHPNAGQITATDYVHTATVDENPSRSNSLLQGFFTGIWKVTTARSPLAKLGGFRGQALRSA